MIKTLLFLPLYLLTGWFVVMFRLKEKDSTTADCVFLNILWILILPIDTIFNCMDKLNNTKVGKIYGIKINNSK